MTEPLRSSLPQPRWSARASLGVMGTLLALALVPVLWPHLDLAVASWFFGPQARVNAADWAWVAWLNEHTPRIGHGFMLAGFVVALLSRWLARWARVPAAPLARTGWFVGLGLLLGPGLLVMGVKDLWDRARPRHVAEFGGQMDFTPALSMANQCLDNCSFVSGHVAAAFFVATLGVMGGRWRWAWFGLGCVLTALVGFGRIAAGAHWLSDVVWACAFTFMSSLALWGAMRRLEHWLQSR